MTQRIRAIYENGVLRPLDPLELPDRSPVDLTVVSPEASNGRGGLGECIGAISQADASEMTAIVDREFERVDHREW